MCVDLSQTCSPNRRVSKDTQQPTNTMQHDDIQMSRDIRTATLTRLWAKSQQSKASRSQPERQRPDPQANALFRVAVLRRASDSWIQQRARFGTQGETMRATVALQRRRRHGEPHQSSFVRGNTCDVISCDCRTLLGLCDFAKVSNKIVSFKHNCT